MNRISNTFQTLKNSKKKALITFIMAGDPDYETSLSILKALPENGADLIELGMPFSDPAADGLTIQKAAQRALKNGASMKKTLQMVQQFRTKNSLTPMILMGYANPLYAYGLENFMKDAKAAGVDGLIIVDIPPEEDHDLQKYSQNVGINIIRLITPTTDEQRLGAVLKNASGFLYYVSIAGVTGTSSANLQSIAPHIETIRKSTDLPVAIGFGIKTPNDAQEMSSIGDAVVVGSSIIEKIIKNQSDKRGIEPVLAYVKTLAAALG